MSFLDNMTKLAGEVLSNDSQGAAQSASDHVSEMDPDTLAGHLKESLGSMDGSNVSTLGKHLLETFDQHAASNETGEAAAQAAGTDAGAVAAGTPGAVGALIDYAKNNPQVLQAAASAFVQRNPSALEQLAPGLLNGILQRYQARGAS